MKQHVNFIHIFEILSHYWLLVEYGWLKIPFTLPFWRKTFSSEYGDLLREGELLKLPKLADTLERIANNPFTFYNGTLAEDIVNDITEQGKTCNSWLPIHTCLFKFYDFPTKLKDIKVQNCIIQVVILRCTTWGTIMLTLRSRWKLRWRMATLLFCLPVLRPAVLFSVTYSKYSMVRYFSMSWSWCNIS